MFYKEILKYTKYLYIKYINVINLKDNGLGISYTKKIMTPYFTTKKNGTGLGLPIVNKIINEHSGDLAVSSNKNKGTEISIHIPLIHEK